MKKSPKGRQCLCSACNELFGSEGGFNAHRVGDYATHGKPNTRRCMTPTEIRTELGMESRGGGVWVKPMSPERVAGFLAMVARRKANGIRSEAPALCLETGVKRVTE